MKTDHHIHVATVVMAGAAAAFNSSCSAALVADDAGEPGRGQRHELPAALHRRIDQPADLAIHAGDDGMRVAKLAAQQANGRSFGMSGLLISEDLRAVEKQFDVDLGHTPKVTQETVLKYYPQFEQAPGEKPGPFLLSVWYNGYGTLFFLPPPMLYGLLSKYSRVSQRLLRVLVDGDRNGLDVLVAPSFPRR
jgi:hypothetical protein